MNDIILEAIRHINESKRVTISKILTYVNLNSASDVDKDYLKGIVNSLIEQNMLDTNFNIITKETPNNSILSMSPKNTSYMNTPSINSPKTPTCIHDITTSLANLTFDTPVQREKNAIEINESESFIDTMYEKLNKNLNEKDSNKSKFNELEKSVLTVDNSSDNFVNKVDFENLITDFVDFKSFISLSLTQLQQQSARSGEQFPTVNKLNDQISSLKREIIGLKEERSSHLKIIESLIVKNDDKRTTNNDSNFKKRERKRQKKIDLTDTNEQVTINATTNTTDNTNNSNDKTQTSSATNAPLVTPYINHVPGQRAWNSATKYGKKVCVFGDSHLRHVKQNLFNQPLVGARANLHWDSGVKTARMTKIADIIIEEEKPDIVVICVGTNDIYEHANAQNIANEIISFGTLCKSRGAKKVFVSAVLPRSNIRLRKVVTQVNDILVASCHAHDFVFIRHQSNITLKDLSGDGKHLNPNGMKLYASNMVDCINYFIHISQSNHNHAL